MKKYIHYGAKSFIPDFVRQIVNRPLFTKPKGGLWASPVDAKYGWKNWNESSGFKGCDEKCSFCFTLGENAKILSINSLEDLTSLPKIEYSPSFMLDMVYLDFEAIALEYDAIEVNISNDWKLYDALYGWDCDSILVMNKDIVKICK